jgi:uncharacterized protein (DUF1800 family)
MLLVLSGFTRADSKSDERTRSLHAWNRLAFGARPGDVERVAAMGVDHWIEQQLHPEQLSDRAVDTRLEAYETLRLSGSQILQNYYVPVLEARREMKQASSMKDGAGDAAADDPKAKRKAIREQLPDGLRPQRVMEELQAQRIIRAAESSRQLNEVMVDFWMNHFNVFAGKGIDRFLLTSYERACLGAFRGPPSRNGEIASDAVLPRQCAVRR